MKPNTYMMIRLAVEGDDTLTESDSNAILAFCKKPVLPTVPSEPRPVVERREPQEHYFRPREVAAKLGVNLRTIQRWIQTGTLESRRVVGCRRIPLSAINKLCEAGRAECRFPERTDGRQSVEQAKIAS